MRFIAFPTSFDSAGPVSFVPATPRVSDSGGVGFAPGGPAAVRASVQDQGTSAGQPDGVTQSRTEYLVYLFDDPAALNGGDGVNQDDRFLWNGLVIVADGPPRLCGGAGGLWVVPAHAIV